MSQTAESQRKRKSDEQPQGRSEKNLKTSDGKPVPTSKNTKETPPPPPSNPNKVTLEVFVLRYVGHTGIALMHGRDVISKSTIEVTKAETDDSLRHKIGIVLKQCLPNYLRDFGIFMIFCDLLCGTAVSEVIPNNEIYSDTVYARLTSFHDSSDAPSMCFEETEYGSPRSPAGADNISIFPKPSVSFIRTSPGNTSPPAVRNWKDDSSGKDPLKILLEIADTHLKGFVDAHELQRITKYIAETAYFNWLDSIPECHVGHMIIQGNPGTGKTTGAWAIAGFLAEAGIIHSNCVIQVQRDDLVGRFVGDTEYRTNKVIQAARGGVVIFDEIYALNKPTSQNDFGKEAFTTIMKYMTSDESPVFLFLGYRTDMKSFVQMNPGFQRRIKHVINLADYDSKALANIVRLKLKQHNLNYEITYGFEEQFTNLPQERMQYYNASLAQDVVDKALAFARNRVLKLPHNMRKGSAKNIVSSDFDEAFIEIGIELRRKDNHQHYFG